MRFEQRLDIRWRLGGHHAGRRRPFIGKFCQNSPVHDLFNVAKSAGDVGSVKHAMVVDQLDDNPARGRVDGTVGQRGRQRRDGVNLLGPQGSVA